jgi:DNA polymerase elongation subunit (family B)
MQSLLPQMFHLIESVILEYQLGGLKSNDKICNGEFRNPTLNLEERKKKKNYKGGYVIDPKIGFYKDYQAVYVLDVNSLYPTMMINNNIIFDTVNCSWCKFNPKTQVTQEIIDLISDDDKNNKKQYWICKNYRGIIPRVLVQYRNERFRQ